MAWLGRLEELKEVAGSDNWTDRMVAYFEQSAEADKRFGLKLERLHEVLDEAVEERQQFIQELERAGDIYILKKCAKVLKDTQKKDKKTSSRLEGLIKDTAARMTEKEEFVKKMKDQ